MGASIAAVVAATLSATVLRRPSLFMSMPVGSDSTRNQTNSIAPSMFADVSDSPKSALM